MELSRLRQVDGKAGSITSRATVLKLCTAGAEGVCSWILGATINRAENAL